MSVLSSNPVYDPVRLRGVAVASLRWRRAYGFPVEPTQIEDPSALFASLKTMVGDPNYDPDQQERRARQIREEKFAQCKKVLLVSEKISQLCRSACRVQSER